MVTIFYNEILILDYLLEILRLLRAQDDTATNLSLKMQYKKTDSIRNVIMSAKQSKDLKYKLLRHLQNP